MSPELVHDEFAETEHRPRLDSLPASPLPEPPEDWQRDVSEAEKHSRLSTEGYQRYVSEHAQAQATRSARERLRQDLPPEERREAELQANAFYEHKASAEHGLKAHRDHKRIAEQIVQEEYDSFATWAESHVPAVAEAAAELGPVLERYLAAYERAQAAWQSIDVGTRAFVADRDSNLGFVRAGELVAKDAATPACPIPRDAVQQVGTAVPRPRIFTTG